MEQTVEYFVTILGRTYPVGHVRGEEAMHRPFRFELDFRVEESDPFDAEEAVGTPVVLELRRRDGRGRTITGLAGRVVRFAARRAAMATLGLGSRVHADVTLVLEPTTARARHRVDIRVFRDKTAPEMVQAVLSAVGVAVQSRLAGSYAARPYTVQWRESDLDFASRLLEDEGIGSFVDETGALVLFDTVGGYDPSLGVLPHRHTAGLEPGQDAIHEVGWSGRITAGRITLRDFNHEHPSLDMTVGAAGPYAAGAEYYDYPGEYEQPPEGSRKARLRAEALSFAYERLSGIAHAPPLRPGVRFTLVDPPPGVPDGELVVVRVRHEHRREESSFGLDFEAIPAGQVWRPLVETPVPTITNPITGFVTGPSGADIHTDEWGRVKVHFPWDRLQAKDDHCSHWVPVLQDNTGHSSAMSRVGWEVACHFLEGDPDRPVVLGRVYNPEDHLHEQLPAGKTRTSLRSETSPRSVAGENKIQFEDQAGDEYIFMQAQRDQNVVVANDKSQQVDANDGRTVEGHEVITVGTEHLLHTVHTTNESVQSNRTESVGGNRSLEVKEEQVEQIQKDHSLVIGGSHLRKMKKNDTVSVDGSMTESIAALDLEASVKTNAIAATRASVLVVGGAILEIARLTKTESTGKVRAEVVGGVHFMKAGENVSISGGKRRAATIGIKLDVKSVETLAISGKDKLRTKASAQAFEITDGITLRVGGTEVTLEKDTIGFRAEEKIILRTSAKNKQGTDEADQI